MGSAHAASGHRAARSNVRRWLLPALVLSLGLLADIAPAAAQMGWWPFGNPNPVPSAPVYRPPPPPAQQPGYQPYAPPPGNGYSPPPSPYATGNRNPVCAQWEQRLSQDASRGNQMRDQLPRIENDIRQADRAYQTAQNQLDRADCYDYFLFAKSLKRTRACVDLANQGDAAKRRAADLEGQRQQILQSNGRSLRAEIVRELARNNCGANYVQEARANANSGSFSGLWDDDGGGASPGAGNRFGAPAYATYRTVCVRLCDGYYFPVSFSTSPEHFDHDADVCQQHCAAPAELYYHPNPGAAMDQAVSQKSQQPYTALRTAFKYRKEFIPGCSCKQAEYVPQPGAAGAPGAAAPDRRADTGWNTSTNR